MKAYAHTLFPLRGRIFWEHMEEEPIYPPLFTKVMGRPKRNRRKAPEEKIKKGVKVLTKAGVTIHCGVCGVANHNKKGHAKYVLDQLEQRAENAAGDDEEADIPYILEVKYFNFSVQVDASSSPQCLTIFVYYMGAAYNSTYSRSFYGSNTPGWKHGVHDGTRGLSFCLFCISNCLN